MFSNKISLILIIAIILLSGCTQSNSQSNSGEPNLPQNSNNISGQSNNYSESALDKLDPSIKTEISNTSINYSNSAAKVMEVFGEIKNIGSVEFEPVYVEILLFDESNNEILIPNYPLTQGRHLATISGPSLKHGESAVFSTGAIFQPARPVSRIEARLKTAFLGSSTNQQWGGKVLSQETKTDDTIFPYQVSGEVLNDSSLSGMSITGKFYDASKKLVIVRTDRLCGIKPNETGEFAFRFFDKEITSHEFYTYVGVRC
ncbi:MAG: hypothetical protein Q7S21_07670 [archaeon]|nr:hypothetical protein [archaeon]